MHVVHLMKPTLRASMLVLAAAALLESAAAQDARALLQLRSLAATCAQCHGTDGRAPADALVPGLAGMPAALLVERMEAFKAGTRAATLMPQLAKGFTDTQIRQLAAYFAAQPR